MAREGLTGFGTGQHTADPRPQSLRFPAAAPSATLAFISGAALTRLVPMGEAIALVEQAMIDLSAGRVTAPERWAVMVEGARRLGIMPGAMGGLDCFGAKLISLFGGAGRASHQGLMLLFDLRTGAPMAVIDGATLTGLRTAAASAVATRALANPDAARLALLGCGEQARWHVRALRAERPIEEIHIWGRRRAAAEAFARGLGRDPDLRVVVHDDARDAVREGDIVCTLTSATDPVLEGAWLSAGQHVNLVGSSTRHSREIDDEGVARGYLIVDETAHALSQAGEFRHALESRAVTPAHLVGEIGEVLSGRKPGRTDRRAITLYKSLGHAAQDLVVAHAALERGRKVGDIAEFAW